MGCERRSNAFAVWWNLMLWHNFELLVFRKHHFQLLFTSAFVKVFRQVLNPLLHRKESISSSSMCGSFFDFIAVPFFDENKPRKTLTMTFGGQFPSRFHSVVKILICFFFFWHRVTHLTGQFMGRLPTASQWESAVKVEDVECAFSTVSSPLGTVSFGWRAIESYY